MAAISDALKIVCWTGGCDLWPTRPPLCLRVTKHLSENNRAARSCRAGEAVGDTDGSRVKQKVSIGGNPDGVLERHA